MIINGQETNFKELINDDFVLVDFHAKWCGPCRMLGPVLEEISQEENIKIVKIDVDECNSLAREYGVMSVPTMLLFKKGDLVSKKAGFMPKEVLNDWLKENR